MRPCSGIERPFAETRFSILRKKIDLNINRIFHSNKDRIFYTVFKVDDGNEHDEFCKDKISRPTLKFS